MAPQAGLEPATLRLTGWCRFSILLSLRWLPSTVVDRLSVSSGATVWIDDANRRVPMRERQIPAFLVLALERGLVGKHLLFDFAAVFRRSLVLVRDDDAIVIADVFAGAMACTRVDGVVDDVAQLLFLVEHRNLGFLKDVEELLLMSPLHFVDPLHEV